MILDTLSEASKKRVEVAKQVVPLEQIKQQALALLKGDFRFEKALKSGELAFICEVKKASPSKGVISPDFPYLQIARDYERSGAAAISVLTEPDYFLGKNEYLTEIKSEINIPVLRKDFTVDEYQIYEAKCIGADAVLLICALLNTEVIKQYLSVCDKLGLSAIVEAHTEEEVQSALAADARIIGVNNRNLKTFQVDLGTCVRLRELVPPEIPFVAESGIATADDIRLLKKAGVNAVLIGETFMKSSNKQAVIEEFKQA